MSISISNQKEELKLATPIYTRNANMREYRQRKKEEKQSNIQ